MDSYLNSEQDFLSTISPCFLKNNRKICIFVGGWTIYSFPKIACMWNTYLHIVGEPITYFSFWMFWQKMKAFVYLVLPNSILSVLSEESSSVKGEEMEHGLITSVTHGVMSGTKSWWLSLSSNVSFGKQTFSVQEFKIVKIFGFERIMYFCHKNCSWFWFHVSLCNLILKFHLLCFLEVDDYLHCLERGRAATSKMSDFLRRNLQPQLSSNSSKAGWIHCCNL